MNKFSEASFSDYIEPKQGKYLVALKTESLRLVMSQNLKLLGCRISNEVLRVNPVGDKGDISLIRPSTLHWSEFRIMLVLINNIRKPMSTIYNIFNYIRTNTKDALSQQV